MTKGTVFSDTDEQYNRVTIGVSSESAERDAIAILDQLGVPEEARSIVSADPPAPALDSLRGHVRPTTGGIQIVNCWTSGGSSICRNCTLSANVWKVATAAFVSNSHYSRVVFGLDGTGNAWTQPLPPDTIATGEWVDPVPFSGGACPSGKICRYSDAALLRYTDLADWEGAHIARPLWSAPPPYEFTVRVLIDEFTEFTNQVVKVGYQTGMTQGTPGNACVTQPLDSPAWAALGVPSNMVLLCQNRVNSMYWIGGDSGSLVFSPSPGTCEVLCDPVYLRGVMWGGTGSTVTYSPVSGVNLHLGNLQWYVY